MVEIALCHLQNVVRISQEYISALAVFRHKLSLLERLELCRVVAFNPTCLVEAGWFPTALCIVLVFKTILNNLELQLTYSTNQLTTVELVYEELCNALVHKLFDTLVKLLCLHWVGIFDILEHLWRETWQTNEVQILTLGKCIADFEDSVIWQTNDIARISLVDCALALCHELRWRRESDCLAVAYMQIRIVADELARTNLAERNT